MHFVIMGLGPWYRVGLSMSNAIILAAIVETIVTWNAVCHSSAKLLAFNLYGIENEEAPNLIDEMKENQKWSLYALVMISQIFVNVLLVIAVIFKGNKRIAQLWVMSTFVKTLYTVMLEVNEQWGSTYEPLEALLRMSAFLWGTILFGFSIITGVQTSFYLSDDDGRAKVSPIGQGRLVIVEYYKEHYPQLAVVLLLSEIATNIHRCFHYPKTAFLMEADEILRYYNDPPSEYGAYFSIIIIIFDFIGLILLLIKRAALHRFWVAIYVIITIANLLIFVYVFQHWYSLDIYSGMIKGFAFISVAHIFYKFGILFVYFKSSSVIVSSNIEPSQSQLEGSNRIDEESV